MSQISTQQFQLVRATDGLDEPGRDDYGFLDLEKAQEPQPARNATMSLSRRSMEQIHADILEAIDSTQNQASLTRIMMSVFLNRNQTRRHLDELVRCKFVTAACCPGTFTAYSLTDKGREILLLHQRIERLYQTSI
jgi:predicted transcriptional regulator